MKAERHVGAAGRELPSRPQLDGDASPSAFLPPCLPACQAKRDNIMPQRRHNGPYIPRADGAFRDWLNEFASTIAADPAGYGRSAAEAAMLVELAQRYEAAYVRAKAKATRSKPATAEKNRVRREAWDAVRPIAMQIKAKPPEEISDAMKVAVGVKLPNFRGSPIKPPDRAPMLAFEKGFPNGGGHRLRYFDPMFPTRFAKPPGVVQCQVFVVVSDGVLTAKRLRQLPPRAAYGIWGRRAMTYHHADDSGGELVTFVHIATRHVFTVPHKKKHIGKTATYFARWATKRGLTSPWSASVTMTIV